MKWKDFLYQIIEAIKKGKSKNKPAPEPAPQPEQPTPEPAPEPTPEYPPAPKLENIDDKNDTMTIDPNITK